MAKIGKMMNLARSIIVPDTMASDTAQNTNWNHHLAEAGTVLAAMAGRSSLEPGLNVGKKPLQPKIVITLATIVPTFFMRLKPTSSMAKPACMNITSTAATMTHTVSAPTPAAWVAVSSAADAVGGSATRRVAIASAVSSLLVLTASRLGEQG